MYLSEQRSDDELTESDLSLEFEEDLSNPRRVYEIFIKKLAGHLVEYNFQPRLFLWKSIFHWKGSDNFETFKEVIPLTRL